MSSKEKRPITYHLEYYSTTAAPDSVALDAFLANYNIEKREDDYVVFSTVESRVDVVRKCNAALKESFYYALVFERDGSYAVRTHPEPTKRRLLSLDQSEQSELGTVLDALGDALRLKAEVRQKSAK
jgi:hypothetical protein